MAYLEITPQVDSANRVAAAGVRRQHRQPFPDTVAGATGKELLNGSGATARARHTVPPACPQEQ
ncbi:hypothetical protein [Streptosporangium lutulentum]|uniref:Uncharacterized protein n=1 Tax=Streptosporangium lutulentum TaxID=1461250 RepID=A0ABT9QTH2_9ACTN|nr:hypothetical protein [Streptosporangium lutulentum]MDP9850057.1 hypothetical protein [Streptosporangium lutulentum]